MKRLLFTLFIMAGITVNAAITIRIDTKIPVSIQEKQYKKIEVSQVSKEALNKIKKSYGNYTIKEANRADDGEYKLVLSKDGTDLTATFTPSGELIKIY